MLGLLFARSPEALDQLSALAKEYENLGNLRTAEWLFKRVMARREASSADYYHLGRLQARRGLLDDATRNLAESLALKPDFYLCRVLFFDLCRRVYWQANPTRLEEMRGQGAAAETDSALERLHLHMSAARFDEFVFEWSRHDDEYEAECAFARLESSLKGPRSTSWSKRRRLAKRLKSARPHLEEVSRLLAESASILPMPPPAHIALHSRDVLLLEQLRDSDDLTGSHFEIILEGKVRFIPFADVRRLELEAFGEFINATVHLHDATSLRGVIPGTYFGSNACLLPEIRRGDASIIKEVFPGLHVGLGRRVLCGQRTGGGEWTAVGFHAIRFIEFSQ